MYQHMSSKRLKESAKARLFHVRGITIGATASYLGILALVQIITTLLIPDVPEYFLNKPILYTGMSTAHP